MTTNKTDSVYSISISSWLADLHMECYKKNMEEYDNIKPLLDFRDSDIKKLGVSNSKDRSRMMNSIAVYRGLRQEVAMATGGNSAPPPPVAGQLAQVSQDSHKSLLRKGSLRKLNFKSFLTSGSSKKNKNSKKATDLSVQMGGASIAVPDDPPPPDNPPQVVAPVQQAALPPASLPPPSSPAPPSDENKTLSSSLADYEELPDVVSPLIRSMTLTESKPFQVPRQPAVENEYVPSPENSPKFNSNRPRANTFAATTTQNQDNHTYSIPQRAGLIHHAHSVNSTPELMLRSQNQMEYFPEEDSPGHLTRKHLSVVSMESGLSFGYDVEKDFNPLESQPWFHGRVLRADAETMLHYDGDFLVRENTTMSNTYTLTLRWRGVADHTLIGTTEVVSSSSFARGSTVKYQFDSGAFDSIPELIYNHLKYQIPIDRTQHTLITNPICRPGNALKGGMYAAMGVYVPISRATLSPESSPSITSATTKRRSGSPPDAARQQSLRRLGRPISISPHDTPPQLSKHLSTSSGNLLESGEEEINVAHRNVISPPPDTRSRAMTVSHVGSRAPSSRSSNPTPSSHQGPPPTGGNTNNHQRVDSFGDYEMMESVSILGDSPSLGTRKLHQSPDQLGHHGNDGSPGTRKLHQSSDQLGHHHGNDASPGTRKLHQSSDQFLGHHHGNDALLGTRTLHHQRSSDQLLGPHHHHGGNDYYSRTQSMSAGNTLTRPPRGDVKYAEIRLKKNGNGGTKTRSSSNTVNYADVRLSNSRPNSGSNVRSGSNSVNYAEVRFSRFNTISTASHQPHPYSLYDTVPTGRREVTPPSQQDTSPYHSRADVLAQRLQPQADPTYSIPNPSAASKKITSRHPISNYVTIQFPIQDPPQAMPTSTTNHPPNYCDNPTHIPIKNTDPVLYAQPDKSRLNARSRELSSSNDSLLSGASSSHSNSPTPSKHVIGSSLLHSHTSSAKVHRGLPGYEALVKAHTILQNHSSDELAYHMTRTDAVSFMLAPRPGEDQSIWRERVKQVTSTSGMFFGLQTLADPDGEKLWKKLYFRHLNLSQIVTLTVVTAGDALERAKLLHRYIEVAQLLQSQRYGNLFSFIAVMQGLAAPQLVEMSDLWSLLENHFPQEASTYKTLQDTLTSIDQGKAILSTDHLIIPPIQHLKPIFHFNDQSLIGFSPVRRDHSVVGEYTDMTTALEFMHTIVSGTIQFTVNAWKQLEGLQYNVTLMEFLTQDFTRVYLQSINVHSDDPMERRRRFGLLMDALIDRVESSESV